MSGSAAAARCRIDLRDRTEEIVRAAARAPSLHNAQPWAFRVGPADVEVYADRRRRVPVADPDDRQLFLGVGAAVFGVRLALADLGLRAVVRLARQPGCPELAAVVTAAGPTDTGEHQALYDQLSRRRTVRGPFTDDAVPVPLQIRLTGTVRSEGATPRWLVHEEERRALAAVVLAAERRCRSDPAFRAELEHWSGPKVARDGAGIPATSLRGAAAEAGAGAVFALRGFPGGDVRGAVAGEELQSAVPDDAHGQADGGPAVEKPVDPGAQALQVDRGHGSPSTADDGDRAVRVPQQVAADRAGEVGEQAAAAAGADDDQAASFAGLDESPGGGGEDRTVIHRHGGMPLGTGPEGRLLEAAKHRPDATSGDRQ